MIQMLFDNDSQSVPLVDFVDYVNLITGMNLALT